MDRHALSGTVSPRSTPGAGLRADGSDILELSGGEDISSASEPRGDFANPERPVPRL